MFDRLPSWLRSAVIAFALGALLGGAIALIGQPREPVFITDSWSYVPADAWWLHAVMVGLTLAIVALAFLWAMWISRRAFEAGLLLLLGAAIIGLLGAGMLAVALLVDTIDSGQQIMFLVMGGSFVGLAAWMVIATYRGRSNKPRPRR